MRAVIWIIVVLVGIIILLLIGVVAGRVGGIAIRREGAEINSLALRLSEPVVRGVPVVVRWESNRQEPSVVPIVFFWRDRESEHLLGQAGLSSAEATMIFPCEAPEDSGTLVVRTADTNQVLGSRAVQLGAPGPECI